MNLQEAPLVVGFVACLAPLAAVLIRPSTLFLRVTTTILAASTSLFLFALLKLIQFGPTNAPNAWVFLFTASTLPVLLSAYLLTFGLGRERPEVALGRARRVLGLLFVAGVGALVFLGRDSFIAGYDWASGRGTIHLGLLGKAYASYLLIGIVLSGYNLESTYRLVPSQARYRLRFPFLIFFGLLGFATFILSTGLLYASIGVGKLVALSIPLTLANLMLAYSFLRGSLTDVRAPVSRSVVYSSFSAVAAGSYVLSVGIVSQIATFTRWSPDEVVTLSFGFLAALLAVLFIFSNRFQRRMRRFVDRNFYVNRYDYRTQWSNVTHALERVIESDAVLRRTEEILKDVFLADSTTIALQDTATSFIRPRLGRGADHPELVLAEDSPLADTLAKERHSLMLDRKADDFEYIGIYAENRTWLDATASQIVAPLFEGGRLVGCIGMDRKSADDPFTYEDVALLDSIAAHIASKLQEVRLAEELAQSREMSLISQWSSMLLHDLKNYLSPLRLVANNLIEYQSTQGIAELASGDITRVADRMERLVNTLSELRENSRRAHDPVDVNELVRHTLKESHVDRRPGLQVQLRLQEGAMVQGDREMLQRVLENLVTNALEAMGDSGTLTIETRSEASPSNGSGRVHVLVRDTGHGIAPEFLKDHLFQPFATTKKGGLGLGLYQSRSIVRAHGGELSVDSHQGAGTTFRISMAPFGAAPSAPAAGPRPRTPDGVVHEKQ